MRSLIVTMALAGGIICAWPGNAQARADSTNHPSDSSQSVPPAAADLDLEQLANMEIKVTSASKKEESLFTAPAAIYVLTGEEIRRGGFTSLPDALRTVPGLYVVRTDSHTWQVSARGFSNESNNKLLVLVDGRSVYTPVSGGVHWDALDMPLENIDRVEVIRGPGGTLWGANAVNGVINVVTKNAAQTQGVLVSTASDLNDGDTAAVQYGGHITSQATYRVFGKATYWEPLSAPTGEELPSNFGIFQAGTRLDWTTSSQDTFSLEGGSYDGRFRHFLYPTILRATYLLRGNHVLARWQHTISNRSQTDTLAYCDWYARFGAGAEERNTCDLEFQHSYEISQRHSFIWGGSFLSTGDNLAAGPTTFKPAARRDNLVSGFVQYEAAIVAKRLRVLVGSKFEHNAYTGFEYQPQIRTVWNPAKSHVLWGSVSRAVREPSRVNSDLDYTALTGESNGLPVFIEILGNPRLQSEGLYAYESGYRFQRNQSLSFDLATFYNRYTNFIYLSPPVAQMPLPTGILLLTHEINGPGSHTQGGELSARWNPIRYWSLSAAVTETRGSPLAMQATPSHLFNVQSKFDLNRRFEFDTTIYRYGAVPLGHTVDVLALPPQAVAAFTRVDVGGTWHVSPQWDFTVWGRNLQSSGHLETKDTITMERAAEIPRSVVFRLTWQSKPEGI
jgi:iron complex outermembrane recepter protein